LFVFAALAAVPSFTFFWECVLGAFYRPRAAPAEITGTAARIAVLMPAHDESPGIAGTLAQLKSHWNERTRLYVVADNCSDDTAQLAADSGATVFERHDQARRGKGYALSYGLEQLASDPPDVVVILDADCEVSPHGIARLAERALETDCPIQADYWLMPSTRPSGRSVVSALAFLVKNRVRPRGLAALGMPCLLTGTGMAFPWAVLRKAPPTEDHLVEDMVMGLQLALLGHPPQLCTSVCVTSALPEQARAASAQRKRWEHGHLAVLLAHAPRLLARGLAGMRFELLALALDLLVPPLSLLVLLLGLGSLLTLAAFLLGASPVPFALFVLNVAAIGIGVIAGWYTYGRELVRARDLLSIPLYVLWKLPLYFGFFTRGKQRVWERTERTAPPPSEPR
jgi:cellulose synthase/poly-beta-1,6-N-acetylglucosamine synthase-like glycosyltransferase